MDKKYFDYVKHNESLNYYDSKRPGGNAFNGINISIQEVDYSQKVSQKPQYGTGNMSQIIALLNEKKGATNLSKTKTKRNPSNNVSMKKLTSLNKSVAKGSYCSNLKSNRDLLSKHQSKNKTYMSNHIKRMLNASLNSSNPSISAHRNKGKAPGTSQIKNLNFGSRGKRVNVTSRPGNFNYTQKINIGEHLECMAALDEQDLNRGEVSTFNSKLQHFELSFAIEPEIR